MSDKEIIQSINTLIEDIEAIDNALAEIEYIKCRIYTTILQTNV